MASGPATKDFRCQLPARLVEALDALAKARSALTGKKIDKADLVAEALLAYLDVVPRLEQAGNIADLMTRVGRMEANVSDQIERGFKAMAATEALRHENEILNAVASYSTGSRAAFDDDM